VQSNNQSQWFIALDGGGTKTRAAICNDKGEIKAIVDGEASNPLSRSFEDVASTIRQLISEVMKDAGVKKEEVAAVYLGLAGADRPEITKRLQAEFGAEWGERLLLDNDAVAALYAGTWGEPGIVLIAGTGSIAYAVTQQGKRYRTGGWGYLVGDEGSGFDLGRRAAVAVMRASDGRGAETLLTELYLEHYQVSRPEELIACIYGASNPRKDLADTSTLVEKAARLGDPIACELISLAADDLQELASACQRKIESLLPVVLAGGLLTANTRLREELLLKATFEARIPYVAPVVGALVAAMKRAGWTIHADIQHQLQLSGRVSEEE
jgi:N-acetylglucosamine kinase-like BadF-type ATPase